MKVLLLAMLFISSRAQAGLPEGNFVLDKIECSNGKLLKIGGPFFAYEMNYTVADGRMTLVAKANARKFSPIQLFCTIQNEGNYFDLSEGQFEGELLPTTCKCVNKRGELSSRWTEKICSKGYGSEEFGHAEYTFENNKLAVRFTDTKTMYSCPEGSLPVYYYTKQ
jgi:hypothetical protein